MTMQNNNTMGKIEYILATLFWCLTALVWYRGVLFLPLDGMTAGDSKGVLYQLILSLTLVGLLITFHQHRSYPSLFVNVAFPYQMYAVISYWAYYPVWIVITLGMTLVLCSGFVVMVMSRKIKNRRYRSKVIRYRLKHALLGTKIITVLCLCAFVLPLGISSYLGNDLYEASNGDTVIWERTDEWSLEKNMDTVWKLKPEVWKTLSMIERLDVLSVVKNIEMRYLGIRHEVYLTADSLDEDTQGQYVAKEHKIVIDINHLKNSPVTKLVETVAHECHHAYTFQLVAAYQTLPDEYKNLLMFYDAQLYEEEYSNYIDGDDDYAGYATQYCEMQARAYAEDAVNEYYAAIKTYEEQKEPMTKV